LVKALGNEDVSRWEIPLEHMSNGAGDKRKHNAEADEYAKNEGRDEDFEDAEASEGAVWAVEEEDEERVSYGQRAACY
jgi:hypothetical protein